MRTRFETVFVMVVVAGVVLASRGTWGDEGKGTVLRWKVPEGQALGFRTDISPVDPKKEEGVQPDVNRMIEDFLGKDGAEKTPMPDMKGRGAMSTILKAAGGGNIAIQMVLGKLEMPEVDPKQAEEIKKKFAAMEGTVQLRAQMDAAGQVTSFYLANGQKNLVAMLFELPVKPVRPGDEWSIHVNLVTMGGAFVCEKMSHVNRVKLVSLEKTADGDILAVMDYCIVEGAKGHLPIMGEGEKKPFGMIGAFVGRGEFLVNKGTWKRLNGRMRIKSVGEDFDANQNVILEPMEKVPEEMLKLE